MLKGKTVILGVSGGIASYKIADLASILKKKGCNVHVIMTENACNFINPITFETLTSNKCLVDTFDRNFQYNVEHVELAKRADLFLVAPATANVIAKFAAGIADDMLSTTFLAYKGKKLIAPSMNTNMFENPITQRNIGILKDYGVEIIEPDSGYLACGDVGKGKLPSPEELFDYVEHALHVPKDLCGKKILITAGATKESLDPVRFITNHSTGKMGFALAKEAINRGAKVALVKANTTEKPPRFANVFPVSSAEDMFNTTVELAREADIIIKTAAVSDYTPKEVSEEKIKKSADELVLDLKKTKDILKYLGENKREGQYICGFSMETENMIENSAKKREKKKADMIVANNLKEEGAGFGCCTNKVTIITKDKLLPIDIASKEEVAHLIINQILEEIKND